MNFLKRLFKSEEKVLASTTVKLTPLNQVGENEKIRKMLINYLITKYGKKVAQKIIDNNNYGIDDKLFPDSQIISIHTKDDKCCGSFIVNDNKIEEMEIIGPNSKEGKILYNHK